MKNTPSALKWLAEKRARISFDLEAKRRIMQDVESQVTELQADLVSLDRVIKIYDSQVDPKEIAPINGWKGSYGKRGALKEAMKTFIREAAPNPISSLDLETLVCLKFNLTFETSTARYKWREGGFRTTIKALIRDGLIERVGDPAEWVGQVSHLRWKESDLTFQSLEHQVATKATSCASPPAS